MSYQAILAESVVDARRRVTVPNNALKIAVKLSKRYRPLHFDVLEAKMPINPNTVTTTEATNTTITPIFL